MIEPVPEEAVDVASEASTEPKSAEGNGKKRSSMALATFSFESFAFEVIQKNSSLLCCDVCGHRYACGAKIYQTCVPIPNETAVDERGEVLVAEAKSHSHCESCEASGAFKDPFGDCAACAKTAHSGLFQTKPLESVKALACGLMLQNNATYAAETEYETLKEKEKQAAIDAENAHGVAKRKEKVGAKRQKQLDERKELLEALEKSKHDAEEEIKWAREAPLPVTDASAPVEAAAGGAAGDVEDAEEVEVAREKLSKAEQEIAEFEAKVAAEDAERDQKLAEMREKRAATRAQNKKLKEELKQAAEREEQRKLEEFPELEKKVEKLEKSAEKKARTVAEAKKALEEKTLMVEDLTNAMEETRKTARCELRQLFKAVAVFEGWARAHLGEEENAARTEWVQTTLQDREKTKELVKAYKESDAAREE